MERQTKNQGRLGDIVKFVVFVGIGFFFIYWFLLKLDAEQKAAIWESFAGANYFWVGVAMACCLVSHLARALRWQLLYAPMGKVPRLSPTFGAVVVAYMANLAFPRLGEVLRCAVLKTSEDIAVEKSLGTVVTERMFDVLAFGVIAVVGVLVMMGVISDTEFYQSLQEKMTSVPSMAVVGGAGVVLLAVCVWLYVKLRERLVRYKWFRKVDDLVVGCMDGVKSILHLGVKRSALFLVYSLLIYVCYILGGVIIFQAFDETQSLGMGAAFVLYLFGSVGMGLSQGGLGVYPVLVMQALTLYGVSDTVGTAAGWLLWSSQQAIILVVGFGYMIYFSSAKRRNAKLETKG